MSQHMLIFSLGPVQSFIAQARKTRDLWLGSYLLSWLIHAAMENIAGEFIFPADRTLDPNISDLPNKYIAIFSTAEDAKRAATQSTKQIVKAWIRLCRNVRKTIFPDDVPSETRSIWKRQIRPDTFFEIFWVIVERDSQESYGDWLERTQRVFDARKRLRDFKQQDEPGEKSTTSGEREALRGSQETRRDVKAFWEKLVKYAHLSPKDISQDGTERLDAIDTVKRFATRSGLISKQSFPSTSSVTTASFIEQLLMQATDSAEFEDALRSWGNETRGPLALPKMPYILFLILNRKHIHNQRVNVNGFYNAMETFFSQRHLSQVGWNKITGSPVKTKLRE